MNSLTVVLLATLATLISGHGNTIFPRARGFTCIKKNDFFLKSIDKVICKDHPNRWDWDWHFPAGPKVAGDRGGGARYQRQQSGGNWTPYDPRKPGFKFRAGVCGDVRGGQEAHLKGGIFYYPKDSPMIAATYKSGGVFNAEIAINKGGHHNGYIEFRLCNVKYCPGGDISETCLRSKHCAPLKRVYESRCKNSLSCAPIDPNYPTRWFVPPPSNNLQGGRYIYKGIKYQLPKGFKCDHCVMQFYWASANQCNPPGFEEYFDSDNAPKWGKLKGQSNAEGGIARWLSECGGKRHTEEYYSCSDIRITGSGSTELDGDDSELKDLDTRKGGTQQPKPEPVAAPAVRRTPPPVARAAPAPKSTSTSGNPILYLQVYVNGQPKFRLYNKQWKRFDADRVSLELVTKFNVYRVFFNAPGRGSHTETAAPYFWKGNQGNNYGILEQKNQWDNKWFKMTVTTTLAGQSHSMVVNLRF